MKIFLITFLLLLISCSWAQDDVKITHYLRTSSECPLLFPTDAFLSDGFNIPVADSIYTGAEIRVRKVRSENFFCSNYQLEVKQDTVRSVSFTVKSTKEKKLLDAYLNKWNVKLSDDLPSNASLVFSPNGNEIVLDRSISGKKWEIRLTEKL